MSAPGPRHEITIRALEVDDAESVARLQAMPGFRFGTLRPPYPTVMSVRQHIERVAADDLFLGAFIGNRLVGTAGLHRLGGRRRHAANLGMGVADDMQGKGIGSALLDALLEAADKWLDIRRIELTVFADNERAIMLYERRGFEREGAMRAFAMRDGHYTDTIAMARLKNI